MMTVRHSSLETQRCHCRSFAEWPRSLDLVEALANAHVDMLLMSAQASGPEAREIQRLMSGSSHVFHLGTKLLPGRVIDVQPTSFDGTSAAVILHRWLGLYGVHAVTMVNDGWKSLYRHAPIRRSAAIAEFEAIADPIRRYEWRGARVRDEELRVVSARSRLIRGAREFARISSMLPFPIQTWLLSIRSEQETSSGPSPLNATVAATAAMLALLGPLLSLANPALMLLWWAALPVQALGGFLYRASLRLDPPGAHAAKRAWIIQITIIAAVGTMTAVGIRIGFGEWITRSAASWLVLGLSFIPGMYLFEAIERRWSEAAQLD
jgi:hypothetical protein